ncbi:MAG: PqiA/YebS family transporter subunit [Methyloprofundus sp.]|nr:PqiA/YebS family transporter subunit [Methyloprofundus sp.]
MPIHAPIISCHDCGLLQQISHMPEDGDVKCCRCDSTLRRRQKVDPFKSIGHTLALVITALILWVIANVYPILQIEAEGHALSTTLFGCVSYLLDAKMFFLAGLVFLTSIGAPLIQLTGMLYIFLPLHFHRTPPYATTVYRLVHLVRDWSMLEVVMLGILVSVVKISALATVIPGIALVAFSLLILFIAAILSSINTEMIWEQVDTLEQSRETKQYQTDTQLVNCHNCYLLSTVSVDHAQHDEQCDRCGTAIHFRKPNSLNRCTALVIAAIVLYIPANLLPVMVVSGMGNSEGDTIISGVLYLASTGDMPLAVILFIASICVPIIKLLILVMLLITVHFKSQWRPKERTQLYRLTELIGRWSMVDIFVDTLMAALIQIEGLMVIEAGMGAVAFGAVVVLTILAAMAFDPRLIWDNMEQVNE